MALDRKEYMRQWRARNKEYMSRYGKEYRKTHPDTRKRPYDPEVEKRRKAKHPDRQRRGELHRLYGITLERKLEMYAEQKGACAICGENLPSRTRANVDHHHETGIVRKLLCSPCNLLVGKEETTPGLLLKVLDYLKKYNTCMPSGK